MSHFTHVKTSFQNLFYLEKALDKLNLIHKQKNTAIKDSLSSSITLVIPQSNQYDIEFFWNGKEYDLVVDMSFWKHPYPIENFIDRIAQEYAGEVVSGESQKMGFQPVKFQQNSDGSNILILERWNNN